MPTNENMTPSVPNHQYHKLVEDSAVRKKDDDSAATQKTRGYFCYPILCYVVGLHTASFISFVLLCGKMKLLTYVWIVAVTTIALFGVTAGVHRLWSHRAYKAKLPLKILLIICYATAGMQPIRVWAIDHRLHHKYSDTDADPHNSKRGLFFSHIGWLTLNEHPDVTRRRKEIDVSDLTSDPVLAFHDKHFWYFILIFNIVIPSLIPVYLWQETVLIAFCSQALIRHMLVQNLTFLVNGFAHKWGYRPYNKNIRPVNNAPIAFLTLGEGWHNYHHTFPWDYKAAELGQSLNLTGRLLDFFAKIGWAYDLKTPSAELVKTYIRKHGDGSHPVEIPPPEEQPEHADKRE
jgi:stearoyl-CoA desaturase (delta-9 desaturase)